MAVRVAYELTRCVVCGGSDSEKCVVYPQTKPITGSFNAAAKTITMTVPKSMLRYLTGPTGPTQRHKKRPAPLDSAQ